jgi:hypothetical protein
VRDLRSRLLPGTVGRIDGVTYLVACHVAANLDGSANLMNRLPSMWAKGPG